jgi:hypothetical protein
MEPLNANSIFNKYEMKILATDKIRVYKFIEMFQYTFIFYFLAEIVAKFLNKHIFTSKKKEFKKMSFFQLSFSIILQLFVLVVAFFYIRKAVHLFPSIPTYFDKSFVPFTTIEYATEISFIFIFLEVIDDLKFKLELLREKNSPFFDFIF